jgi:hypothetical protein
MGAILLTMILLIIVHNILAVLFQGWKNKRKTESNPMGKSPQAPSVQIQPLSLVQNQQGRSSDLGNAF